MVRDLVKRAVESAMAATLGRPGSMAGRSLILAYHNVVPDHLAGRGDASLHLPLSTFIRQVELISRHLEVLPLADLLAGPAPRKRPTVAITFDDAYVGTVELAMPELRRRGLAGTVFVAPGLLGDTSFWWDELAEQAGGMSDGVRTRALIDDAGRHQAIRSTLKRPVALPAEYGCAEAHRVIALAAGGGVTLGGHSWSHPNLARLTPDELARELADSKAWLDSLTVPTIPVLAYPYGLSSAAVEDATSRAGYRAGLLVDGGWSRPSGSPWAVPRYNVPAGLSDDGLLLRLSGYLMDNVFSLRRTG